MLQVGWISIVCSHIASIILLTVDKKAVVAALPFAAATPTNTLASINPGTTATSGAEALTLPPIFFLLQIQQMSSQLLNKMIQSQNQIRSTSRCWSKAIESNTWRFDTSFFPMQNKIDRLKSRHKQRFLVKTLAANKGFTNCCYTNLTQQHQMDKQQQTYKMQ